jgi:hypothetical protein
LFVLIILYIPIARLIGKTVFPRPSHLPLSSEGRGMG